MRKPVTMTVYLMVDEHENPHKWNVAEWLDSDEVVGWDIEDGHRDCPACEDEHGEDDDE